MIPRRGTRRGMTMSPRILRRAMSKLFFGAGLKHLKGISRLGMYHCTDEAVAAAEGLGLPVARRMYTRYGAFDPSFVEKEEGDR